MFLLAGLTLLLGLLLSEGAQDASRMDDLDRQIRDLEKFLKSDHIQKSRKDIVSAWSNLGEIYSSEHFRLRRS
jgi:chromosome segregation ATPase